MDLPLPTPETFSEFRSAHAGSEMGDASLIDATRRCSDHETSAWPHVAPPE